MQKKVILEQEAQQFADKTAKPPFLYELGPEKGRKQVDEVQSGPVAKPDVAIEKRSIPGGPKGEVPIVVLKPKPTAGKLPVIVYIHGAGWVFGNAHTHDRLVRELAVGSGSIVVFPEYSLSPEHKYPTAIEEIYAVVQWVAEHAEELGAAPGELTRRRRQRRRQHDRSRDADGEGARRPEDRQAAAVLSGHGRVLRHGVVQAVRDRLFPEPRGHAVVLGPVHDRSRGTDAGHGIAAAASAAQLEGLPPALIITGEADVLRDEGEAYAAKLREAGVRVTAARFQGMIHDFVMLNALAGTAAARAR